MSNEDITWKDVLSIAALVLALCIGLSTCQYIEHRIEVEKKETKP